MFRHSLPRRLPYPHHPPPPASMPLPAIPPSMLPQNVAPTSFQKGVQATGFVLATGLGLYAVLLYDFGQQEHCFMPIRRYFDEASKGFFTLSERDRMQLGSSAGTGEPHAGLQASHKTPIQFFKDESDSSGKELR